MSDRIYISSYLILCGQLSFVVPLSSHRLFLADIPQQCMLCFYCFFWQCIPLSYPTKCNEIPNRRKEFLCIAMHASLCPLHQEGKTYENAEQRRNEGNMSEAEDKKIPEKKGKRALEGIQFTKSLLQQSYDQNPLHVLLEETQLSGFCLSWIVIETNDKMENFNRVTQVWWQFAMISRIMPFAFLSAQTRFKHLGNFNTEGRQDWPFKAWLQIKERKEAIEEMEMSQRKLIFVVTESELSSILPSITL